LYELVKLTSQVQEYPAEKAARALSSALSAAERSFFFASKNKKKRVLVEGLLPPGT